MNHLLDITGHFLYIILSIILLPVFVALDIVLGVWMASRLMKRLARKVYIRAKQKQPEHQFGFRKGLLSLKARFIGVHVNSN